jgi:1A family penicillin-binding protein
MGFVASFALERAAAEWTQDLPSVNNMSELENASESHMLAADGKTDLASFQLEKRKPVKYKNINPYAIQGTIDVEDTRFYEHNGVDQKGILRALVNNLVGTDIEGASTITQQLVRNTLLSQEADEISLKRKVREGQLALDVEKAYSKEEILTMYLNTINYGDGCYGIEAAAQNYFQKSNTELSLAEVATLIGIPQSPTNFNPKENPEACLKRRNTVLDTMLERGTISQEEHDKARDSDLNLNPSDSSQDSGIYDAPYFTSYVRSLLMETNNEFGCSYADLFQGGLTIYTTLDTRMQDCADKACKSQYDRMSDDLDIALVATDPSTGAIRAMVGGKDFDKDQWNIATQGGRPAGSAFKTFTLTAAIEEGIDPNSTIDCSSPLTMEDGNKLSNFGGADYGTRTIADATAISSNTGYYRLAQKVGGDKVAETAHRMGIESDLPDYPIITLGTENVTPLEMAGAYGTLASGGIKHKPIAITKIVDKDGKVLYEASTTGERVLDEQVASQVTDVLRGVFDHGTASGASPSNGQPVAGKTGTGQEFRDHWLVGYSPTLVCATWIGNRDYSSTSSSITCNALWKDFMSRALAGTSITDFPYYETSSY